MRTALRFLIGLLFVGLVYSCGRYAEENDELIYIYMTHQHDADLMGWWTTDTPPEDLFPDADKVYYLEFRSNGRIYWHDRHTSTNIVYINPNPSYYRYTSGTSLHKLAIASENTLWIIVSPL